MPYEHVVPVRIVAPEVAQKVMDRMSKHPLALFGSTYNVEVFTSPLTATNEVILMVRAATEKDAGFAAGYALAVAEEESRKTEEAPAPTATVSAYNYP